MDIQRRTSQGRLSEIFGSDLLYLDKRMRTLGIYNVSLATEEYLKNEQKTTYATLQAYCNVRYTLSTHTVHR